MKQMIRTARVVMVAIVVSLAGLAIVTPAALACGGHGTKPAKTVKVDKPADVNVAVEGMTCGGCADKIQNALMDLEGVVSARVDHEAAKAYVHYDAAKVDVAAIKAAIEKAGYKAGKTETPKPKRHSS